MDDLTQTAPRLRPGVRLVKEEVGQQGGCWLIHAPEGRCFLVGEPEAAFLALVDGTRGCEELRRAAALTISGLNAAAAAEFMRRLALAGLLAGYGEPPMPRLSFSARIVIADPGALLMPLCGLIRRLPPRAGAAALAALLAVGAAGIAAEGGRLLAAFAALTHQRLFTLAILIWLLGLGHEAAHALAALLTGIRTTALGMAVAPLRLAFFAEIPGLALLPRRARVWIAASGPIWDAAVGSVALLLARIWPAQGEAADLLAAAALLRAAWNLLPVPMTDGAYLLTQLIRALWPASGSAVDSR